jgi:hypothetical protein
MNAYEIYIITSILCGCVAAGIAKIKGHPPILWFFIGAALNVLVFTAILVYTNRQEDQVLKTAQGSPKTGQ